jgi:hypothetical protein
LIWREIILEPGLKILAEENWLPAMTRSQMENRIQNALDVLLQSADKKMEK